MSGVLHGVMASVNAGDPYFSSVVALLKGNGSNGSTTITDSSPLASNWTAGGNAVLSTTQSKYGGTSIYFDGNGDWVVPTAASSNFTFGTGDFTIEGWFRFLTDVTSLKVLWNGRPNNTTGFYSQVFVQTGKIIDYLNNQTGTTTISLNQWYHVAQCRSGTTTRIFVNGNVDATYTDTTNYLGGSSRPMVGSLGYDPSLTQYALNGYVDDFRITKGVARYTAAFPPPSEL